MIRSGISGRRYRSRHVQSSTFRYTILALTLIIVTQYLRDRYASDDHYGAAYDLSKILKEQRSLAVQYESTSNDFCFVTSVFAPPDKVPDQPPNVADTWKALYPNVPFYFVTNRPDVHALGWTKIVLVLSDSDNNNIAQSDYTSNDADDRDDGTIFMQPNEHKLPHFKRFITYSRYGKFMSWQIPTIRNNCKVVYYMDGYIQPKLTNKHIFQQYADQLTQLQPTSNIALAQFKHPKHGGILAELARILQHQKDFSDNVNATIQYLRQQSDFYWNCTLYENTHFAFDTRDTQYQTVSTFFWQHYSLEQDSWRDQPLWCFVMDRFKQQPVHIPFRLQEEMYEHVMDNLGQDRHRYTPQADNDAAVKRSIVTTKDTKMSDQESALSAQRMVQDQVAWQKTHLSA